jgi:hypothetical protein
MDLNTNRLEKYGSPTKSLAMIRFAGMIRLRKSNVLMALVV